MAGSGTKDIWAVGSQRAGGDRVPAPDGGYMYRSVPATALIEHWNGSAWTLASAPADAKPLGSVSADSPTDAWAVGQETSTLLHWDGKTWRSATAAQLPTNRPPQFTAVLALSKTDAWAVGFQTVNYTATLIEHWDGRRWEVVPSPGSERGVDFRLNGITSLGPDDVWAVGERYFTDFEQTLVEHWDGRAWSLVPSPNVGSDWNFLYSVAAVDAHDVWAFGHHYTPPEGTAEPLIERWDGASWIIQPTPHYASDHFISAGITTSRNSGWALGAALQEDHSEPFVLRWDGTRWTAESTCRASSAGFTAALSLPDDETWFAGTVTFSTATREWSHCLVVKQVG